MSFGIPNIRTTENSIIRTIGFLSIPSGLNPAGWVK